MNSKPACRLGFFLTSVVSEHWPVVEMLHCGQHLTSLARNILADGVSTTLHADGAMLSHGMDVATADPPGESIGAALPKR